MMDLAFTDRSAALIDAVVKTVDSPYTKKDYSRELRTFFHWIGGNPEYQGEGFSRSMVLAYREAMIESGRGPVPINKSLSAIRKLAAEACDQGAIDSGVAGRIAAVPQVPRRGQKIGRWLTLEELRRLVNAVPPTTPRRGARDRALLVMMGTCGLRRAEAASLTVGQLQHRDGRPILADILGKGKKLRSVPVHEMAAVAMRGWISDAELGEGDPLFPAVDNPDQVTRRPMSSDSIREACLRYLAPLGIEFNPHDLRRTFALLAKRGGADYEEIRQALGHSSIVTTERYLRQADNLTVAAADKIQL